MTRSIIGNFHLNGTRVRAGRAFIIDDQIVVFQRAGGGKTEVVKQAQIAEYTPAPSRREPHLVLTTDGERWSLTAAGCGCGSPIKTLKVSDAMKALEVGVA